PEDPRPRADPFLAAPRPGLVPLPLAPLAAPAAAVDSVLAVTLRHLHTSRGRLPRTPRRLPQSARRRPNLRPLCCPVPLLQPVSGGGLFPRTARGVSSRRLNHRNDRAQ